MAIFSPKTEKDPPTIKHRRVFFRWTKIKIKTEIQPWYNKFFCEHPKISYQQPQQPQDQVNDNQVLAAALERRIKKKLKNLDGNYLSDLVIGRRRNSWNKNFSCSFSWRTILFQAQQKAKPSLMWMWQFVMFRWSYVNSSSKWNIDTTLLGEIIKTWCHGIMVYPKLNLRCELLNCCYFVHGKLYMGKALMDSPFTKS